MKIERGQIWASKESCGILRIIDADEEECIVELGENISGICSNKDLRDKLVYIGELGEFEEDTIKEDVCANCIFSYADPDAEDALCCLVFNSKGLPKDHFCARYEEDIQ